ncbi:unnamed protein product [Fusarium graminearum]|nr:unnamed protein product [Fusarium graminearum]CAG1979661.1 unnamed protein product [Fusarium graminearum]
MPYKKGDRKPPHYYSIPPMLGHCPRYQYQNKKGKLICEGTFDGGECGRVLPEAQAILEASEHDNGDPSENTQG